MFHNLVACGMSPWLVMKLRIIINIAIQNMNGINTSRPTLLSSIRVIKSQCLGKNRTDTDQLKRSSSELSEQREASCSFKSLLERKERKEEEK